MTQRLTLERRHDAVNFITKITLCKDGNEVASINSDVITDLTFNNNDPSSPFNGPVLTPKQLLEELFTILKAELNDSSLDDELYKLLKNHIYEN